MAWLTDPNTWIALLTLTGLEIVLGVDNIVFITILAGKLPKAEQAKARKLGLAGAFVTRVLFLLSIVWIMRLEKPLFELFGRGISGRGLILITGGLFLIFKATREIHGSLEGEDDADRDATIRAKRSVLAVVAQIMVVDIVFSIDSVVTAVGMAESVLVMIIANLLALIVMLFASAPLGSFVERHPTIKVLALSFLVLIGTNLVAEGFGVHVPKGYTYVAMAFSVVVEMLNIRVRKKAAHPVKLHRSID